MPRPYKQGMPRPYKNGARGPGSHRLRDPKSNSQDYISSLGIDMKNAGSYRFPGEGASSF